ncbi:MAG: sugar ABC transporter permease [Pleurocapsa minor GSE-CHR-MK-17-07R]|jgi:glucose/mannose transport system permease protein|nr:sugar ABC transporter permease [Pleurocapsa minor GSE-CHR-MK 17-07R]
MAAQATVSSAPPRRRRFNRDRLTAILMILPSLIFIAIFVYGFIAQTGYTSLTDSNALQQLSRLPANFIGFSNYNDMINGTLNERFRTDMVNTVFFTVLFIVTCLVLGIGLAILLDQKVKGESIFRTIFLFPMALSFVVTGVVWKWLFNPTSGLNALPTLIGLPRGEFRWFISQESTLNFFWQDVPTILGFAVAAILVLAAVYFWIKKRSMVAAFVMAGGLLLVALVTFGDPNSLITLERPEQKGFNLALIALVVAAAWQMSGYTMAMYLAGLRGIPEELREAARVDGASEFGVYLRVVLPLLAPITLSAMIILGHISLKIFDLAYTMGGGDNLFIDMPGLNMYFLTFRGQDFARGATVAMVMLVMVAFVIVPYLITQLRGEKSL